MNKREFNEKMSFIINSAKIEGFTRYTCYYILAVFSISALIKYESFIKPFLRGCVFSEKYYHDTRELRFYLLEQFRDHCLRTGTYKEF